MNFLLSSAASVSAATVAMLPATRLLVGSMRASFLRPLCASGSLHSFHSSAMGSVASPARNLYPLYDPSPTLVVEGALDIAVGRKGKNILGKPAQGAGLNEDERLIMNKAKRIGYIVMSRRSSINLCNRYLRYCWARRRPYVAISQYGNRIVVDLLPSAGVGASANPTRVDRLIAGVQAVVDEQKKVLRGGILISNVSSKPANTSAPQGSDAAKPDDKAVSDQFSLYIAHKDQCVAVATKIWSFFTSEFAELTPEQLAANRSASRLARKAKWEARMVRHLRRLVADPKLFKRAQPGTLDGFIRADKEGRT